MENCRKTNKAGKLMRILFVIEGVVILFYTLMIILHPSDSVTLFPSDFSDNSSWSHVLTEKSAIFAEPGEVPSSIESRLFSLKSGTYDLTVEYASVGTENNLIKYDARSTGSISVLSDSNSRAIQSAPLFLTEDYERKNTRVWIHSFCSVDDVKIVANYDGYGLLEIRSVEISEYLPYRVVSVIGIILVFVLLDLFIIAVFDTSRIKIINDNRFLIIGAYVTVVIASLFFFGRDLYQTDDFPFHANRIISLSNALVTGQLPQRMQHILFNGYGYITPLFYGEIFLTLPALLYCFGLPVSLCYQIYVIIANVVTLMVCYWALNKMIGDKKISFTGSILYTLSVYRIIDILYRGSVGEYTAIIFFPLCLYGFWHIYFEVSDNDKLWLSDILPLVISLTGIIQSHTLSCLMCALFIFLFVIIFRKKTFKINRFKTLVLTVAVTLLVNIWFLLPMLDSFSIQTNIKMEETDVSIITLIELFFPFINYYWMWWAYVVYYSSFIMVGVLMVSFIKSKKKTGVSLSTTSSGKQSLIIFSFAIISILMPSDLFPWKLLEILAPAVYAILAKVQYAWRYFAFTYLFFVFSFCLYLKFLKEQNCFGEIRKCIYRISVVFGVTLLIFYVWFFVWYKTYPVLTINDIATRADSLYLPVGTDISQFHSRNPLPEDDSVAIIETIDDAEEYVISVSNNSDSEKYVDIPITNYPNYKAADIDTQEQIQIANGYNNRIRLMLDPYYDGTIAVWYQEPVLWRVSEVVSLCSIVALIVIYIMERKRRKVIRN